MPNVELSPATILSLSGHLNHFLGQPIDPENSLQKHFGLIPIGLARRKANGGTFQLVAPASQFVAVPCPKY
jgi:hypothetical protein